MYPKFFIALFSCLVPAAMFNIAAQAATCLNGGCHQKLTQTRYVHGPVAAESIRTGGCVVCHVVAGKQCTATDGGKFTLQTKGICLSCHDRGTGAQHSAKQQKCLSCHAPHGSDTNPYFLRQGVK